MVLNNYGTQVTYRGGARIDNLDINEFTVTDLVVNGDVIILKDLDVTGSITSPSITDIENEVSTINASLPAIQTLINTNATNIANNTTNISTNTTNIASNVANIAVNTVNIATNTTNITNNATNIATNATNISNNTTNITTNTTAIATNTAAIATNTADVATNTTSVNSQTSSILANTSGITSINSSKAAVLFRNTSSFTTSGSGFVFPWADRINGNGGSVIGLIDSDRTIVLEQNKRYWINLQTNIGARFGEVQAKVFSYESSSSGKINKEEVQNSLIIGDQQDNSAAASLDCNTRSVGFFFESTFIRTLLEFEISFANASSYKFRLNTLVLMEYL